MCFFPRQPTLERMKTMTERMTDRQTDIYGRTDGQPAQWTCGQTEGQMDKQTDGRTGGQKDRHTV